MELSDRLQILLESKQISSESFNIMQKIILMIDEKWGIKLTEENGAMFITHIVMAFERIKNGNGIEEFDNEIYNQICSSENFQKSKSILEDIKSEINLELPVSEDKFILLYLCSLLDNYKFDS